MASSREYVRALLDLAFAIRGGLYSVAWKKFRGFGDLSMIGPLYSKEQI
jgi:hypothetical protein